MIIIIILVILQNMAISLGVGSATLAIVNFFVAIADGSIDETERRMMGIVYVVLRIAMAGILTTTFLLVAYESIVFREVALSGLASAMLIIIFVLFTNAVLMTMHLVPSTIGPAIQAGSWYALSVVSTLQLFNTADDYFRITVWQFLLCYAAWLVLAIGIVNGIMAILKAKRQAQ